MAHPRRRVVLAATVTAVVAVAGLGLPRADAVPATSTPTTWTTTTWSDDLTVVGRYQLNHAPAVDFVGHPLDVAIGTFGTSWTVGEFGMQLARGSGASTVTRVNVPLKTYVNASGTLTGWTEPFASTWGGHASASELGESIVAAGSSVWAAQGGQQSSTAIQYNHSLLTRVSTTAPYATCAVPLPGDNNEVIGLAYDSSRDRIWFAESAGDHLASGSHSTIGWVKASGLGSRCQNTLDYGGNPALTPAANAFQQALAQGTINGLQCNVMQESMSTGDCVHIVTSSLPSGATHLTYDATSDALWMTNWYDRKLRKVSLPSGAITTYDAPDATVSLPVTWQIAANSTAVFVNEYNGNRILRFDKAAATWASIEVPTTTLAGAGQGGNVQTHSIALSGDELWFTVSDEDFTPGVTAIGKIDVSSWASGSATGVLYTGWSSLPMQSTAPAGNKHSFRGIDVREHQIAVTDHGDMQTLVVMPDP